MEDKITMLKIENLSKVYKLGEIGGTTLKEELQRLNAKIRRKEDPTKKIGAKNYNKGETFKALNAISFSVKKGERIGIIGHNGAGKSTLLKLISRVTAPTEGAIYMNGRVTSMLEVGTGFHGELTGRENIYLNGAILGMTRKEIDRKIEEIIDFSEVRQFIDTPVKRYSSGMYVKLAFSVAAHLDSEIVIMDEVLAVGDMAFQNKCLTKMKDVSMLEGRTVLYVSHNMNTIRQLCDRVIVLDHGKLIYDGEVEKGISIYLNQESECDNKIIRTSELPRGNWCNLHCLINKIVLKDREKWSFIRGEQIQFSIDWESKFNEKDLFFRTTVRTINDVPLGSFGTPLDSNVIIGKYSSTVIIDSKVFNQGVYNLSIGLFQKDSSGNLIPVDHLTRIIHLEILENQKIQDSHNLWVASNWGNIHFYGIETHTKKID